MVGDANNQRNSMVLAMFCLPLSTGKGTFAYSGVQRGDKGAVFIGPETLRDPKSYEAVLQRRCNGTYLDQARSWGVPGGLVPSLFQQKNEDALLAVHSLYQKGRFP